MIEVRNISPAAGTANVSINSNVTFDLVGLDGDTIDIDTLAVTVTTLSKIDGEEYDSEYSIADSTNIFYSGSSSYYSVVLNPEAPFDHGMTVTIKINVDTEGDPATEMEEYVVSFSTVFNGLVSVFESTIIQLAQQIPVYDEVLKKDKTINPKTFYAAFGNWNRKPAPVIELNGVILNTGYSIDYSTGQVIFDETIDIEDQVKATYRFRFFEDEQIQNFFKQANAVYSMAPPYGGPYDIYSATPIVQGVLMLGAGMYAFRNLLLSLAFQEQRLIWDNASAEDGWTQVKDIFKQEHDFYKEEFDKALEYKKMRLASMRVISAPEFTLPGGRSRFFRYLWNAGSQ